ncbi:DMT family transporter [Cyanobacterium aponinum FACHB-4101]|uniref:DMT family transporter n=1 Tax=Cyanobacterium aponinum TaxID=379064 RepID=UPI000C12D741|nr:DMT family transporter [Cyanobacterium aponinum]MBD2394164.1 DMT family transporter [Cyanobacterium aponinum FACHB-4101]PHV62701.1 EamA family transporter [Cyanobacterium aponinum IPPAS B-1201]
MNIPSDWQKRTILGVGIICVSLAAIFVRLSQREINEVTVGFSLFIAAGRLIISTLLLIPSYGDLWTIKKNHSSGVYYGLGAGICLGLHFATWISSLGFTSVAASVSLVTTNPLWVALLSWWCLGQKLTRKTIIGIAIAVLGSVLIAFAHGGNSFSSNPLLGAILALMGSWFASGYILLGTLAQQKGLTTKQYVIIAYFTGALCLLPLPPLFGTSYGGHSLNIYIYLILMAIISQIIGHTSLNWSLKYFSPTTISLLILFEPVISSLFAWWFFQEIPQLLVVIGALILLLGVTYSIKKKL